MLQGYALLFEFMEALGKKWVVPLLIFLMFYEKSNFSQMKKKLKLTSRALSKKLKLLEAFGLIEKTIIDRPGKIVYALSEKGREISQTLIGISSKFAD